LANQQLTAKTVSAIRSGSPTRKANEINAYTFIRIANNMLAESPPFVGCEKHQGEVAKRVTNNLETRAEILAKRFNPVCEERRMKEQKRELKGTYLARTCSSKVG